MTMLSDFLENTRLVSEFPEDTFLFLEEVLQNYLLLAKNNMGFIHKGEMSSCVFESLDQRDYFDIALFYVFCKYDQAHQKIWGDFASISSQIPNDFSTFFLPHIHAGTTWKERLTFPVKDEREAPSFYQKLERDYFPKIIQKYPFSLRTPYVFMYELYQKKSPILEHLFSYYNLLSYGQPIKKHFSYSLLENYLKENSNHRLLNTNSLLQQVIYQKKKKN